MVSVLFIVSMLLTMSGCGGAIKNSEPAKSSPAVQQSSAAAPQSSAAAPAATTFPEKGKQIRLIITHGVGGSVDTAGRSFAPYLEKYLGVPVVPENMEGAGGRRAMEFVFAAKPDGYTIVVSATPSRLIGQLLYPESKYVMKEFVHLSSPENGDYRAIVVGKDSKFNTFQELMDSGKNKKLKAAGGGGTGSTSQLQTVYLKDKVKMPADFIPFESTAEVSKAVISKEVDFGVQPLSSALRFVDQGTLKILAIHAPKRSERCPDVPTMEELGYKDVVCNDGIGVWAPPGTPKEIQDKYADALAKMVKDPEFLEHAKKTNAFVEYLGPKEFLQQTLDDEKFINTVLPLLQADIK